MISLTRSGFRNQLCRYNVLCPLSDTDTGCCWVHDLFVIDYGGIACDLASPEGFAAVVSLSGENITVRRDDG